MIIVLLHLLAGLAMVSHATRPPQRNQSNAQEFFLMGTTHRCYVVSSSGEILKTFDIPKVTTCEHVAIGADPEHIIIAISGSAEHTSGIYASSISPIHLSPLVVGSGYYAHPVYDKKGKRILYAHAEGSGGPNRHMPGAYAQLYSIPDVIGGRVTPVRLTFSVGCHYRPVTDRKGVLIIHSNCNGTERIESLDTQHAIATDATDITEATRGPFVDSVVFVAHRITGAELDIRKKSDKHDRRIVRLLPTGRPVHLASDARGRVYFQYGREVRRYDGTTIKTIATLPTE